MTARTDRAKAALERAPDADAVYRVGLGAVILLAGVHKLLAPWEWSPYLAPLFADRWPVPVDTTMVVFGLTELPVGLALLLDRYVSLAAGVVAVSMVGTVLELAILLVQTGRGGDVLIRDLAVLALATGVTIRAVRDDR